MNDLPVGFLFGITTGIAICASAGFLLDLIKVGKSSSTKDQKLDSSSGMSAREATINRLEREFTITTSKLHEIVKHFVKEMQRGLAADDQTLKMIPSYVIRRATGQEQGVYLALDLGGSNFRVCEVFLEGKGTVRMKQKKYVVSDALKTGDGKVLFDFFASSIKEFYEENGISMDNFRKLGFTFSFPCYQTSINKGKQL